METFAYADVCDAAYWRTLCPDLHITSTIQHGVPQVCQNVRTPHMLHDIP